MKRKDLVNFMEDFEWKATFDWDYSKSWRDWNRLVLINRETGAVVGTADSIMELDEMAKNELNQIFERACLSEETKSTESK